MKNKTVYFLEEDCGTCKGDYTTPNIILNISEYGQETKFYCLNAGFGFYYPNKDIFKEFEKLIRQKLNEIDNKENIMIDDYIDPDIEEQEFKLYNDSHDSVEIVATFKHGNLYELIGFYYSEDGNSKIDKDNEQCLYYRWENGKRMKLDKTKEKILTVREEPNSNIYSIIKNNKCTYVRPKYVKLIAAITNIIKRIERVASRA